MTSPVMTGTVLANTLQRGGSAGFIALLLVVLIFLATVLLIRNMSGRLKRLPQEFPEQEPRRGAAPRSDDDPPV